MEEIQKAESTPAQKLINPLKTEIGQPRIVTSSRFINEQRTRDFQMPNWLCVVDEMYRNDSVYTPVDYTNLHVVTSLYRGEFVAGSNKAKSKAAAEYLNYCIRNMSYGTWWDVCCDASTDLLYGWNNQNIVIEKKGYGPYSAAWTLRKLVPWDQKSTYGWIWNKANTEVLGVMQHPSLVQGSPLPSKFQSKIYMPSVSLLTDQGYPVMWNEQMLHFKYNAKNNNPQGDSPFIHIYQTWKELDLVRKYEVIGVSKDLGGALIIRVPGDLIKKASNPDLYPNEAQEYADLQSDAARLHAGESTYIVLTSDVDEVSKTALYDIQFKGVDGAGKQFKTTEIIEQKKKDLFNAFGAGFMLLGQDSVGSYNLASSHMSTHAHYVERNITQKVVVLENQLAPRLLAANDYFLSWKDMPKFVPADPTEFDWDIASKFIQRVASVNKITPKALEFIYKKLGFEVDGIEDLDYTEKGESRAGESKGTSGTGKTQAGGSNSSTNMENKSVENYVFDEETKDEITLINTSTGKPHFIPKVK